MYRRAAIRHFSTLGPRQFQFPSRSPKLANGENVKLYRVQFRKPPIRRRFFNGLLYAIPAFALWYYVIPVSLEVEISEEEEKMKPDGTMEVEDEDDLEDGLFIPFGWPKEDAKTFYKGSDPEWKEYMKLAKDPKRKTDIQVMLAKGIRAEIARHPSMKRQKIDVDKGRYWFWIKYPDGPPQDYRVSGLEIGDEFVAWSTKIIPQSEYRSLARTIMPTAAMGATWVVLRYHFDVQANKVREYFGLQPHMDPQTAMLKSFITASIAAEKRDQKKISPPLVPPIRSKEETSTSSSSQKVDSSTSSETDEQKATPSILASFFPKAEQVPVTTYLFMHNLTKGSPKKKADPPRGSIEVKGMLEVIHKTATIVLDVEANYDLNTNKYLEWTFKAKEVQPRQQRPKGGR